MKLVLRKIVCTVLTAAALLPLFGCSESAHVKAITAAVVAYTDYYIEVRNLGDQVRAQANQADPSVQSIDYVIRVDIPDYNSIDPAQTGFVLPEPDVSSRSATSYQQQAALALRQAMEQYVMQNGADQYLHLTVTFSVNADGAGWTANLSSRSKLDIQQTIEDMILGILQKANGYSGNLQRMQISSALPTLLADAFGGAEYAQMVVITSVAQQEDRLFTANFSYPDPAFVYGALGANYISSYTQPFYGSERAVTLTTVGLKKIDLSGVPRSNATVSVSYDEATQSCALLDDGGLSGLITTARSQAENDASAAVNARWRVPPSEIPKNGSVLEGKSTGNQIVFKTGTDLGKYFYVRFYAISGEDTNEEGALQLGVFIVGGKSAQLKLPKGYYRVSCVSGESWYGLEHLFGSDMKTYSGGNAIQSRNGYINTITFE